MSENKVRVFYAEDDPFMVRMYERMFKLNGIDVEFAFDGASAIEKLRNVEQLPDLILLDVMMPGTNGIEVLKFIKGEQKLSIIPVILFSNLANVEDQRKGVEMGAVEYLVKSDHEPKDVAEKILALVAARKAEKPE